MRQKKTRKNVCLPAVVVAEYIHPGLEVELGVVVQLLELLGLGHVTPAQVAVCKVVDPDPEISA